MTGSTPGEQVGGPDRRTQPEAAADPVWAALAGVLATRSGLRVLDVGGGSGTMAVPLAGRGCRVTVIDSSIDALAILQRRAAEAGVSHRVEAVQADADRLAGVASLGEFDFVLCHHVLEELDDPAGAVRAVAAVLAPGGALSVLVAGRWAAVLGQALAGRYGEAESVLTDPAGRWGAADSLRRRFDAHQLTDLLSGAGLDVSSITGLRVAAGLVGSSARTLARPGDLQLARLDELLSTHPQLRELGTDLHALAHPIVR